MKRRNLFAHPFVLDNLSYGFSGLIVNLLNYLYILMAIRFLSKETFGAFNALVAILTLATVMANPLLLHGTKQVSGAGAESLRRYYRAAHLKMTVFAGAGFVVWAILTPHLSALLKVEKGHILFLWLVVVALILATFANGISTGLKKLKFQAALNSCAALLKFLLAAALFKAGFGIGAGLSGYLGGFILIYALTWLVSRAGEPRGQDRPAGAERRETIVVLALAYLFVTAPFSLDQVLAQALNPAVSGDYAALATLGKSVFFVSTPFQVVLYSYLVGTRFERSRQMKYFHSGMAASLGAALTFSIALWIGGRTVTGLLLSSRYAGVSEWVAPFSLGMCGYVFSYAVVLLGIVRDDLRIVGFICIASVAQPVLFFLRHETLEQMITNQILCMALLSLAALAYLVHGRFRGKGAREA